MSQPSIEPDDSPLAPAVDNPDIEPQPVEPLQPLEPSVTNPDATGDDDPAAP